MPKIFKTVGKHALSTGVNIANDMLEGKRLREVAGQHAMEGLKSAAQEVAPVVVETTKKSAHDNVNQSGSGHRRRKRTSHEQQQQQRKRQRKNRDIFN